MAGLWESWDPGEAATVYTFTILTTEAVPEIRGIHPRMPVILPADSGDRWLDPDAPPEALLPLLGPFGEGMQAHPVSTLVNSPKNDVPECIQPTEAG
jgi:putative SOS response-associated peptidase YedK